MTDHPKRPEKIDEKQMYLCQSGGRIWTTIGPSYDGLVPCRSEATVGYTWGFCERRNIAERDLTDDDKYMYLGEVGE
jgi:hypothetical protein